VTNFRQIPARSTALECRERYVNRILRKTVVA
jgi:hypothetical protein